MNTKKSVKNSGTEKNEIAEKEIETLKVTKQNCL